MNTTNALTLPPDFYARRAELAEEKVCSNCVDFHNFTIPEMQHGLPLCENCTACHGTGRVYETWSELEKPAAWSFKDIYQDMRDEIEPDLVKAGLRGAELEYEVNKRIWESIQPIAEAMWRGPVNTHIPK